MSRQNHIMEERAEFADPMIDILGYTIKRLNPAVPLSSNDLHIFITSPEHPGRTLYSINRDDIRDIFVRQKAWESVYGLTGSYSYNDGTLIPRSGTYSLSGSDAFDATSWVESALPHTVLPKDFVGADYLGMTPTTAYAFVGYNQTCLDEYLKENILPATADLTHLPDIYYNEVTDLFYVNLSIAFHFVILDGPTSGTPNVIFEAFLYAGTDDLFGGTPATPFAGTFNWYGLPLTFWYKEIIPSGDPLVFISATTLSFDLAVTTTDGYFEYKDDANVPLYDKDNGSQLIFPKPDGFET